MQNCICIKILIYSDKKFSQQLFAGYFVKFSKIHVSIKNNYNERKKTHMSVFSRGSYTHLENRSLTHFRKHFATIRVTSKYNTKIRYSLLVCGFRLEKFLGWCPVFRKGKCYCGKVDKEVRS